MNGSKEKWHWPHVYYCKEPKCSESKDKCYDTSEPPASRACAAASVTAHVCTPAPH